MASTEAAVLASKIKLPSGHLMPRVQLGLYCMSGKEAYTSVKQGLRLGYRGFDSAQMYGNEAEAGSGIAEVLADGASGLKREDVFYTSKLASNDTFDGASRSIDESFAEIRDTLGHIDLFLLHSPYGGRKRRLESWRAVEQAIDEGKVRSGGVSNYGAKHIEELMQSNPRIRPSVNQIEVHPFNTREDIREVCARYGIVVEAYAPLARAMRMKHPKIVSLSKKYNVTPAQLLVKWSLQHDLVPLPKSTKEHRMRENADVGGFEISADDMKAMDALDEVLVTDWDPTNAP